MALIGNAVTQNRFPSVAYVATAAQTTFPASGALPETAVSAAGAIVTVNGLRQHTDAYSIGTTLEFTAGLTVGDAVEVVWLGLKSVTEVLTTDLEITTQGKFLENYASITSNLTTASSSQNRALIGPISVSGASTVWTLAGELNIL
jgi:hypothetical protein